MPELPEVETVMRGLDGRLTGRIIARAILHRPDLRWTIPPNFAETLSGATVLGFRRRGKYMFMRLGSGISVLIHLGMSGRMLLDAPFALHEHLTLETSDGGRVGFVDPRRFGALDLISTNDEDTHKLVADLGPEPLGNEFNAPFLLAALVGKATPIKAALLDQTLVAGIGNIYASEALFRAGISPRRLAGGLGAARVERLVPAVKTTLTEAIAAGGSSLRDYVQPSGELGYFQHAWKVYDRAGEPCERCPGPPACAGIRRLVQTGRASFYCPLTQR
jgi:formamidopyrimidine-DNA glycosylase